MMRAKIHRARVTRAYLDYVGSISLCPALLEAADLRPFEQVHVLDIANGARFVTYAMEGDPGEVCLNGAAARLVGVGDLVIVIAYAEVDEAELAAFSPRIVHVDAENRPVPEELARQLARSRRYQLVPAATDGATSGDAGWVADGLDLPA
jgi:aspartate 1-decarboxylase